MSVTSGGSSLCSIATIGRVDDEQQQRRFERLCKRGSERRDEIVRQLFDEADRVRVVVSLDILHVLFQLGEAIADLAAIEIEIGLARAGALLTPTARQRMSA
jgi:hypothetical protein